MKLAQIQKELKAPKGQFNKFGNFKYRSCEDILEAIKPLLNGEATITITDEIVQIGERYYVKATATFKGEDEMSVSAFAREAEDKKGMDASQITGATSSYARKYALNGLFAIDDTKDADDGESVKDAKPKAKTYIKPSLPVTKQIELAVSQAKSVDDLIVLGDKISQSKTLTEEDKEFLTRAVELGIGKFENTEQAGKNITSG